MMIKNDELQLKNIGIIFNSNGLTAVFLKKEYIPALLHLELFSHCIIFSDSQQQDKYNLFKSSISSEVCRIVKIDGKRGIIYLDRIAAADQSPVWDVKPYFPCEDRVQSPTDPFSSFGTFRAENNCEPQEKDISEINNIERTVRKKGTIINFQGEYFIQFDNKCFFEYEKINQFSHIKILWWFDRFDKPEYRKVIQCNPPYENAPKTGIFASRSPVRPNPIAMTTAKVLRTDPEKNRVYINYIDCFEKSTVVEVLPYIAVYDRIEAFTLPQWLEHWPQWLDEGATSSIPDKSEMEPSLKDRIKKYIKADSVCYSQEKRYDSFSDGVFRDEGYITIKGAKQNNLKNITVKIPKNKITLITGVSGSGKSSLAFDTLYAESQRRFMDSISTSGKMAFEQFEKPDVEQITNLPPAIAIEQKTLGRNPRSTVGTITDIYDYLKLLYARVGTRHCPQCGKPFTQMTENQIINTLLSIQPHNHITISPFGHNDDQKHFVFSEQKDRIFEDDLAKCVSLMLKKGKGAVRVLINEEDFLFQTTSICYRCEKIFFELTPADFSFNNPQSMCPVCKGLGVILQVDPELIVSDPSKSLLDGASNWWGNLRKHRSKPNANWMKGEVLALAEQMNVDLELPWKELPQEFKTQALYGSKGKEVRFVYENSNGRKGEIIRPVEGACNIINRLFRENNGETAQRLVSAFMNEKECTTCHGERLSPQGRMVVLAGKRFPQATSMKISELLKWLLELQIKLDPSELEIAQTLLNEMTKKLKSLSNVGVSYLSLDRAVPTLSPGEAQRIRLASQLGNGLSNLLYILDEPSMGLHAKDHKYLIQSIKELRDNGNTVVMVEHNTQMILNADYIIDMGPGAGEHGGYVIAQGNLSQLEENCTSLTAKALKEIENEPRSCSNRRIPYGWLKIIGATHNNLKNIDVEIPLGLITCVTGVSGSGKSSLISKTLFPMLNNHFNASQDTAGSCQNILGIENIDNVLNISQQPIGRTPRSNPATYTGLLDEIRELFAAIPAAKKLGYRSNKFSFNSKEGQCPECSGEGRKCIEMNFMPDVWIQCPQCKGKRFNQQVLEIFYNGKNIADILEMTVEEALTFFSTQKKISRILTTMYNVGLGYIKLGQSALTLSGGEAQRIKLSKELSRETSSRCLYILDEPTTGLHYEDIKKLLKILSDISDAGNTVLVIEHNPQVIKNADWIIDLGPEGGDNGGFLIFQGTVSKILECEKSFTGQVLKTIIKNR
ncbi:MAG TPA: excinuclease ABC subunit UvrA [Petrotogaceae bacterium]|nr:excinuclease ABC subunit UvrA [Petrotogaceae bacterium]